MLLTADAEQPKPVLREEVRVRIDGVTERWRLEWRTPPELECFDLPNTCPCYGFAIAERGELELVRLRPGKPAQRTPLTPLFVDASPGAGDGAQALLRRWEPAGEPDEYDPEALSPEALRRVISRRKQLPAMVLGDYDHDGQAREFVLQTAAMACGMYKAVLVGFDRRSGRIRALGSVEHPDQPLVLEPETWELLRKSPRVEAIEHHCGDHASEVQNVARVYADKDGLHATREFYACTELGERGESLSRETL